MIFACIPTWSFEIGAENAAVSDLSRSRDFIFITIPDVTFADFSDCRIPFAIRGRFRRRREGEKITMIFPVVIFARRAEI